MFVSMKSQTSLEMGHVGSKTRSLGQISEKPCVRSRSHIFSPVIMKCGQNVYLDEISDRFENGSCWVKTKSLFQILEKPCVCSRSHIFSPIIMKLCQNVLMKFQTCLKMGHVRSKTRSVGQILEKNCVRSRGHIFSLIIAKLDQNVCHDEILDEFENRLFRVKN